MNAVQVTLWLLITNLNAMIQVWPFLGLVNYVSKSLKHSQCLWLRLCLCLRLPLRLSHSYFLYQLCSALKTLKLMVRDLESLRTSWRALLTCGKVAWLLERLRELWRRCLTLRCWKTQVGVVLVSYPTRWSFSFILGPLHWSSTGCPKKNYPSEIS